MKGGYVMKRMVRTAWATSASVLALGVMIGGASASGIINSSQSTVFNGMAYAGAAAPGSSSAATMFMNPATMTSFSRLTIDSNYTFGVPTTKINGGFNAGPALAFSRNSGDIGVDYFSPATYIVYPVNDRLVVGVSVNGTYGNSTKPDAFWQGSFLAATSKLRIITVTPSVAYKINDMFSVGVGLQIQYASARQYANPAGPAVRAGILDADGWGVGFTAGVTFTPTKTTQIGLGWRSFVDHKVSGTAQFGGAIDNNASGTLNLPNRVNLSLRQTLSQKFDLLASVEWQNLARLGNARLNTVIPQLAAAGIPFGYSDGWFFSLGGEYRYNDALTLRAGIGYEISGVTDSARRASLPDNDRLWLSAGMTYEISERFALNASYSYLHIKKAPIVQAGAIPGTVFTGTATSDAHLISIGFTSKWGAPPKREALVTKF
jgi:long-chain fatty acid transport protein